MIRVHMVIGWMTALLAFFFIASLAAPAGATPQFTTLYDFSGTPGGQTPEWYGAPLEGADGNFYGTTLFGGTGYGTVFKITPSGTLTTIYSFPADGTGGAYPYGTLVQGTDGNLYGTTSYYGGADRDGTVFKITPSGTLTTLVTFTGANGAVPYGGLIQGTDGDFYGTTSSGGTVGNGTIFKMTPAGILTTLVDFNDGGNGNGGYGSLVQGTDGDFYGMTFVGGADSDGTVFKVTPSGTLTTLVTFTGANGANPYGGLIQGADANFYGATSGGGANNTGTVFRMTPAGSLTTIYGFSPLDNDNQNSDGVHPDATLVQGIDGNFYGTTQAGGSTSYGTVFKVTPSGTLTTLVTFTNATGFGPTGGLMLGSDGNFYGAAPYGGTTGDGTVFEITAESQLLHSFTGSDGGAPYAGLIEGANGDFYGTTEDGGANIAGTVFGITPSGALTTLVNFDGNDGQYPFAGLVQDSSGNLYGTTSSGGSTGDGIVFEVSSTDVLSTLVDFTGANGAEPFSGLVQGADGDFYGTTEGGGSNGAGTAFKLTSSGTLTTLVSFVGANGANPQGALVEGGDGNFYGMTAGGGTFDAGTAFQLTPSGALTPLYNFGGTATDGANPYDALVEVGTGNFYGTTSNGGANGTGTVFHLATDGTAAGTTLTILHSFAPSSTEANADGLEPVGGLVVGTDGNLYGTTDYGGLYKDGTAFRITPSGVFTTLVRFDGPEGADVYSGLTSGSDGDFYGTTYGGGTANYGTVYRLYGPPQCDPQIQSTSENTPLTFPIGFSDPSGIGIDTLSFPGSPSHGTVQFVPGSISETGTVGNGMVTYTPNAGFIGTDTFTCTVTGATGTSGAQPETVQVNSLLPTVTSFTPASDPIGTVVTVTGTNLNGVTGVRFHNANATVFSANAAGTQLTVTVPTGAATGTFTVTTPAGSVKTKTNFTVIPAPTVTSFTPTSGPIGTVVTATGTNLNGVTGVRFHNANATAFSANGTGTQLTVTVPTGAATGTFTITTPGGSVKTKTNFTVIPAPTITSFSPTSGPVGTEVTVDGTNFEGATAVEFDGTPATYTVISSSQIVTHVPTGAATGFITVTTPGGVANSPVPFSTPPVITSFSPTSGSYGTYVMLVGAGYVNVSSVKFNGVAAMFTVTDVQSKLTAGSHTQITTIVPNGATTGYITVTTPSGTATSPTEFTVTPPTSATLSSLSPSSAPAGSNGFTLLVYGSGFVYGSVVQWQGTSLQTTPHGAGLVEATVPMQDLTTPGRFNVTVVNPGAAASPPLPFTVN